MSSFRASNLAQRVVSAIVLIVVALTLTWLGGVWYRVLAAVIGGAVFYEWVGMTNARKMNAHLWGLVAALAALLMMLLAGVSTANLAIVLLVISMMSAIYVVVTKSTFWGTAGFAYAGLTAISLAALRGDTFSGLAATVFLFAVVWATDILAYFSGRTFGGPKLAPSISPGKTWSGAIGGTLAAIIAGLLAASFFNGPSMSMVLVILILCLSVVSQLGDLVESSIKRRFGVKDSSQLIPGHGGVMDRVDGLAVAAWLLFLVGGATAGFDSPTAVLFSYR